MIKPEFLLTKCMIVRRDEYEYINSPMSKYETMTVSLEFISSGNTSEISSELIIEDLMTRLRSTPEAPRGVIPETLQGVLRVAIDTRRLVRLIVINKRIAEMKELINNTSADDLRSSLGCSYNPEISTDLNLDLETLETSLRAEQSDRKRPTVIKILEARITKYRKFIKKIGR